jgi:hypothetical protein
MSNKNDISFEKLIANAPRTAPGYLPANLRKKIDKFIEISSLLYVQFGHAGQIHKNEPVAAAWGRLYEETRDFWQYYDKRQQNARAIKNKSRRK